MSALTRVLSASCFAFNVNLFANSGFNELLLSSALTQEHIWLLVIDYRMQIFTAGRFAMCNVLSSCVRMFVCPSVRHRPVLY